MSVLPNASTSEELKTLKTEKRVFYKTADDPQGLKVLHALACGCCRPQYIISTESIKIETINCCSQNSKSIDVDEITDLSMYNVPTPAYCCYDEGHIRLYVKTEKLEETVILKNIAASHKVFEDFSSHIHKINNLKWGMKRPETKDVPHLLYDSDADPCGLKFFRSICCCKCWCFPRTVITKEKITTTTWGINCKQETLQMDLDNVTDVNSSRGLTSCCFCGSGTIDVTGTDKDQKDLKIQYVARSQKVFDKLNEVTSLLNNRNRAIGTNAGGVAH
eukprot:c15477_g1_i1.p1 GENE.c15477_g1_i1~~c15477_g1_i1.p1  ORF type:complete len:283 (+),score=85.25 c15477_g1_i1:24-851(+)